MRPVMLILCLLAALSLGCSDPGPFVYGSPLSDEPLQVHSETAGIYPSEAVLDDPNNPFARAATGASTKWDIEGTGNHVMAYYSWATWLTIQPTGEHQYYVALNLAQIWKEGLARQEDLPTVHDMAVAAYQSVLDNFPDAATFDATGTFSFELVTAAYNGIIDLGGTPTGGWTLVAGPDGNPKAVRR